MPPKTENKINMFLASLPLALFPLVLHTAPEEPIANALGKVVQILSNFGFECLVASGQCLKNKCVPNSPLAVVVSYLLKMFGSKDTGSKLFESCQGEKVGQKSTVPLDQLMPSLVEMSPKTIFASKPDLVERVCSRIDLITDVNGHHTVLGFPVIVRNITNDHLSISEMAKNLVECFKSTPVAVPLITAIDIPSRKMGSSTTQDFEFVFVDLESNEEKVLFRSNIPLEDFKQEFRDAKAPQSPQEVADNRIVKQVASHFSDLNHSLQSSGIPSGSNADDDMETQPGEADFDDNQSLDDSDDENSVLAGASNNLDLQPEQSFSTSSSSSATSSPTRGTKRKREENEESVDDYDPVVEDASPSSKVPRNESSTYGNFRLDIPENTDPTLPHTGNALARINSTGPTLEQDRLQFCRSNPRTNLVPYVLLDAPSPTVSTYGDFYSTSSPSFVNSNEKFQW